MADTTSFAPSPSEKMSLKFILDEIRDRKMEKETTPSEPTLETQPESHHELCGTADSEPIAMAAEPELAPQEKPATPDLSLPDGKKYFRIGEVSEIVGVEPYVLRYWESEFKSVRPVKTSAGHRVYARKDVEMLHKIRILLHVEKFSIKGAKRALLKPTGAQTTSALPTPRYASTLKEMAHDLKTLIQIAKQW